MCNYLPRKVPNSEDEFGVGASVVFAIVTVLVGAVLLLVQASNGHLSEGGLITVLAGAFLSVIAVFAVKEEYGGPVLLAADAELARKSYDMLQEAKKIAAGPHLKDDSAAQEAIQALDADQQRLLQLGVQHFKDTQHGVPGRHDKFLELRQDMINTYQALQTLRDEKQLLAETSKHTSRDALRTLEEHTRNTREARAYLNET